MKRSYEQSNQSPFVQGVLVVAKQDDALHQHLLDFPHATDEELTTSLAGQDVCLFAKQMESKPTMRKTLEKIPKLYQQLLKHYYTNFYVLCHELSSSFLSSRCFLTGLYERSIVNEESATKFEALCSFYTLNPRKPSPDFKPQAILNYRFSTDILQCLGGENDLFSDFFAYQHKQTLDLCYKDVTFASSMADLYSSVYPFGCPDSAYYTKAHHDLRAIALDLVKALTLDVIDSRLNTYNPLLFKKNLLTEFVDQVTAIVDHNKELLRVASQGIKIESDKSYAQVRALFFKAKKECTKLNAHWLFGYTKGAILPLLPLESSSSLRLTQLVFKQQFVSPIQSLKDKTIGPLLYHETLSFAQFDAAMLDQLAVVLTTELIPVKPRKELLNSLGSFILYTKEDRYIRPLALRLYEELYAEDDSLYSYWMSSSLSIPEKLQQLYKQIFYLCTSK